MSALKVYDDMNQLAHEAAKAAVDMLWASINKYDRATWVLAGGKTPLAAYHAIATGYQDAIDWSKVTLLLGDERMGNPDDGMNNWHAINHILATLPARKLPPRSDLTAEESAADYARYLGIIPKDDNGLPRLDLVWLGVGDDGHTMSLFPNHESLFPSNNLVIPVHNSPKPPSDRISFSLRALQGAANAMVLTSGSNKQAAVTSALSGNNLPITLAINIIEMHEGNVTWFIDREAAPVD